MYLSMPVLIFAALLLSAAGSDTLRHKRSQRMSSMGNFTKMFGLKVAGAIPPGYKTAGPANRTRRHVGRHQSTPVTFPQQSKNRRLWYHLGDRPDLSACSSAAEAYVSTGWATKQCGSGMFYKNWHSYLAQKLDDDTEAMISRTGTSSEVVAEILKAESSNFANPYNLPDDSVLSTHYQAGREKALQEAKDPSLTAKSIVSNLARASTENAFSDDKPQLIFLPQEYCDCSESVAADEDHYYFLECVNDRVETTMPQKATAAKWYKEIYSTKKATAEQAKSDACAHICQAEATALNQAMESLKTECSSEVATLMSNTSDSGFTGDGSLGDRVRLGLSPVSPNKGWEVPNIRKEHVTEIESFWEVPDISADQWDVLEKFGEARGYSKDDIEKSISNYCRDAFKWEVLFHDHSFSDANKKDWCSCPYLPKAEVAFINLHECMMREVDYIHPIGDDYYFFGDEGMAREKKLKESASVTVNNIKGCKSNIPKAFKDFCERVDGSVKQHDVPATSYGAGDPGAGASKNDTDTVASLAYVNLPWLVPALALVQYY